MTNPLNELFNVPVLDYEELIAEDEEAPSPNVPVIIPPPPPPPVTTMDVKEGTGINNDPDTDADYELARNTYTSIINKGNEAVNDIHALAKELEHPRAYEVLATLMKQVTDTTTALFELQKTKAGLKGMGKPKDAPKDGNGSGNSITVEKAVFVGTPAEMLDHLNNDKPT